MLDVTHVALLTGCASPHASHAAPQSKAAEVHTSIVAWSRVRTTVLRPCMCARQGAPIISTRGSHAVKLARDEQRAMQGWAALGVGLAVVGTALAQGGPAPAGNAPSVDQVPAGAVEDAPAPGSAGAPPLSELTNAQLEAEYLTGRFDFARDFFASAAALDGPSIYDRPERRLRTQLSARGASGAPLRPMKIDVRTYASSVANAADLSAEQAETFRYLEEELLPALQSFFARSVRVRFQSHNRRRGVPASVGGHRLWQGHTRSCAGEAAVRTARHGRGVGRV